MAIDRESRAAQLTNFAAGDLLVPRVPKPVSKPLDVHVARAAADNLNLNVVNLNYEIRKIVVAQGIQFHNADTENEITSFVPIDPTVVRFHDQLTIPKSLQNDFPSIVLQGDNQAVFISDPQRVEFHIEVVNTKDAFKEALLTPGIHVVYSGHARFGRGPCFGPDLRVLSAPRTPPGGKPTFQDRTGDDWENGSDPVKFGLFRMGHPFVGVPFSELDEHKYHMHPVPTTQKVNPADVDPLTSAFSLKPIRLKGTPFEAFVLDNPMADTYWGCTTVDGDGLLLFAGFTDTKSKPLDLGATDLRCRCLSLLACDTFKHFHPILRKRKGFTRTVTEGFAYFTTAPSGIQVDRFYLGSLFEFPERNDFQSWYPSLEFAVKQTNEKLAAIRETYRLV
ncbi:MAG: hypothetical protein AB1898_15035 [Acidobacteriota bacterium]